VDQRNLHNLRFVCYWLQWLRNLSKATPTYYQRPKKRRDKFKTSFGDVGVVDNDGMPALGHHAPLESRFAVIWPDDDRVHFLLDQILLAR
jgi:hypothetical protein